MNTVNSLKARPFKRYRFGGQILSLPREEQEIVFREILNNGRITPVQYQMLMDFPEKTSVTSLARKRLLLDELIKFGRVMNMDKLVDMEIEAASDKPKVQYVPNSAYNVTISAQYDNR